MKGKRIIMGKVKAHAIHEKFMGIALRLARKGKGKVNPNPMVGAVLVKNGKVVGRGYHKSFGGPHAEVHALSEGGNQAEGGDLYVSLEPCSHYGKTGPCTEVIMNARVKRVFIPSVDPNPLVRGKGVARLRRSGIEVVTGVCEEKGRELNRIFYHCMKMGKPFISLKMAITADGFIAGEKGESKWITTDKSRRMVHHLRALHDSVLVGIRTLLVDDPYLNVRLPGRYRQPLRVIIDPRGEIQSQLNLFSGTGGDVIAITSKRKKGSYRGLDEKMEVIECQRPSIEVEEIIKALAERGVTSIFVEGGSSVYTRFVEAGVVDRFYIFMAGKFIGRGLSPFENAGGISFGSPFSLKVEKVRKMGGDILIEAVQKRE